jgi:hypothetical protein
MGEFPNLLACGGEVEPVYLSFRMQFRLRRITGVISGAFLKQDQRRARWILEFAAFDSRCNYVYRGPVVQELRSISVRKS